MERMTIPDKFGSMRPNFLTLACKPSIFNGCAMPWTSNGAFTCSGQEYQLLEWLTKVVYPKEAKFADDGYAQRAYPSVVRRLINFGVRLN